MKKILITGTKGFIASSLLERLKKDIGDLEIDSYDINGSSLRIRDQSFDIQKYDTIVHLGAISETNSKSYSKLFEYNILDTLDIFKLANPECHIIYASSASVYGEHTSPVTEEVIHEIGNSPYAKSKKTIDNIARYFLYDRNITGLRFFNVCSFDKEQHKQQPSPTYSFSNQLDKYKKISLFHNSDSIFRDFIFIEDVLDIIIFFMFQYVSNKSDIFNIGTGIPVSFENIADALIEKRGFGKKEYIEKPKTLTNNYQQYTCANINKLRNAGYHNNIPPILEYI
jgi:ADP-L-glycero-D-manno-heptose 6-epimerase